jgi:uncharacterized hydantoinase/oxoprolinase family protein
LVKTQRIDLGTKIPRGTITTLIKIIASIKERNGLIDMVQTLGLTRVVIERLRTKIGILHEDE